MIAVAASASPSQVRGIVARTRGSSHGSVTRLVSPRDLGQRLKPFVFLDLFAVSPSTPARFSMHPHSGIATLTTLVGGEMFYSDRHGNPSSLAAGGLEWMMAGGGVWHGSPLRSPASARGFQLWVALPPALESADPVETFLGPDEVPIVGPARVLLGDHKGVHGGVTAPSPMTYLLVTLEAGERWTYTPPPRHDVAWLAVDTGEIVATDPVQAGELAVFEDGTEPIEIVARVQSSFVFGSAVRHPHDLVTGSYSVHTNATALVAGEARIAALGAELRQAGRI